MAASRREIHVHYILLPSRAIAIQNRHISSCKWESEIVEEFVLGYSCPFGQDKAIEMNNICMRFEIANPGSTVQAMRHPSPSEIQ